MENVFFFTEKYENCLHILKYFTLDFFQLYFFTLGKRKPFSPLNP